MKKVILSALCVLGLGSLAHAQDFYDSARGRFVREEVKFGEKCLGGNSCQNLLEVRLPEPAVVSRVELSARDNVGNTHRAVLNITADGSTIDPYFDIGSPGGSYVSKVWYNEFKALGPITEIRFEAIKNATTSYVDELYIQKLTIEYMPIRACQGL